MKRLVNVLLLIFFMNALNAQDADSDGVLDADDNCVSTSNADQEDSDAVDWRNVAPLGTIISATNYSSGFPASRAIDDVNGIPEHIMIDLVWTVLRRYPTLPIVISLLLLQGKYCITPVSEISLMNVWMEWTAMNTRTT